jgi:pilus assembly protein Flp/PilA
LKALRAFAADESGATAIEYGLIAALVAVGIIAALGTLRDSVVNMYNTIGNALTTANSN